MISRMKLQALLDSRHQYEIIHEYFWHKLLDFVENSSVVAESRIMEFGTFDNYDFFL